MRLHANAMKALWSSRRLPQRAARRLNWWEQGEGLLHDVAELAQALDVRGAPAGDHRHDASASQLAAHSRRVVRLVAQDRFGAPPRVSRPSGHRLDAVDQGEGLGDVVDVRCGGDDVQRGAASVADQVVFAARLAPVDR